MDVLTAEQRQFCMSRIRGKDTRPEMVVRKMLHALGYRYRLHVRGLPGCPDLVFSSRRKIIFVHGCFWHRHSCKYGKPVPATRTTFWKEKFKRTVELDKINMKLLKNDRWDVMVVWECQTREPDRIIDKIVYFLNK